jgi:hypothetical protein
MRIRTAALTFALAVTVTGLTACREEGTGEKVGEKIDRTTDDLKDKLNPDGPAEKAGKKIDRAIDDATH